MNEDIARMRAAVAAAYRELKVADTLCEFADPAFAEEWRGGMERLRGAVAELVRLCDGTAPQKERATVRDRTFTIVTEPDGSVWSVRYENGEETDRELIAGGRA